MAANNQHIIQKSRLQLQMGSHLDAHQLQNRILDIFQTRILPKMEAVLDSLAGPDVVLHFDRLELPLGALSSQMLDKQLEERILAHLEQVILKALAAQGQGTSAPLQQQGAEQHQLAQLLHFLERGTLTWAHASNRYDLDAAIRALLDTQPALLLERLLPALLQPGSRHRFQLQCSPATQAAVLEAVHPAWRQAWEELPAWIEQLPELLALVSAPSATAQLRPLVRDFVLELWAAHAADKVAPDLRPLARALASGHFSAATFAKAWLAVQVDAVLAAGRPLPTLAADSLSAELQRIGIGDTAMEFVLLRALAAPAGQQPLHAPSAAPAQLAAALLLDQALPTPDRVRIVRRLAAADAGSIVRLGERFPRHAATLHQLLELASGSSAEVPDPPAPLAEAQAHPHMPGDRPFPGADAPDAENPGPQQGSPAQQALHRKAKGIQENPSERTYHSAPVTEHYVDHAGLVLLNPFFQHCFDGLGWLDGSDFADESRREDAVLLMAYTATGEWEHPEGTLALEKLLCGMPLEQPVRKTLDLPDSVLAEAENLIQSAVHYWDKLGSVSTESFRYTFLNREGVLRPNASGWLLKVNRTGVDILTEFMPWGYGIVRLPWMRTILSVDW